MSPLRSEVGLGLSQVLDSEPELLIESSRDRKIGLLCDLKPFQKVIWDQAEKRDPSVSLVLWGGV